MHLPSMNRLAMFTAVVALDACGSASVDEGVDTSTQSDPPADSSSGSAPDDTTGRPTSGVADSTGGTTSGSSGDEVVEEGPIMFDVVALPDAPPIQDGCNAVDFLFVIDNSGSMYDKQVNLINNFPTFSQGIQSTLSNVTSYQVGVVSTDAYALNDPPCGMLGDLVISTQGGFDSSNMVCGPYADGHNYMTEEDDLDAAFACAAQLGTNGDGYEKPMEAMVNTVGEFHDGPGECNEGFIRDEALLVIVIITDEYDGMGDPEGAFGGDPFSDGDPETWYQAVVDAKDGIEQNAVVMSLINYHAEEDEEPSPCVPLDAYSDYGPIFQEAIGVIETACDNFIPPG